MQVLGANKEHEDKRDDHAPTIELPLARLAEHEENEGRVEEVLAGGHPVIIRGQRPHVLGAQVEPQVDLRLNPRV